MAAQYRIETCRREMQDGLDASFRRRDAGSDGRGPSINLFDEHGCRQNCDNSAPGRSLVDSYNETKGKGKAGATSDHEEDCETSEPSVAASSPERVHTEPESSAPEHEEPEQTGSAPAHEESEYEDLYGVSDKESAKAHDEGAW